jgi:hypothetical protein
MIFPSRCVFCSFGESGVLCHGLHFKEEELAKNEQPFERESAGRMKAHEIAVTGDSTAEIRESATAVV